MTHERASDAETAETAEAQEGDAVTANGQPEAYMIPRALAQATVDYLAMRPYAEVFALIRGFEALEPVAPPDDGPARE